MKNVFLLQLGFGNIGKEVVKQLKDNNLRLAALFNSRGGWNPKTRETFSSPQEFISRFNKTGKNKLIVVDVSNTDANSQFLFDECRKGTPVVLSNKKPLCLPLNENILNLNSDRVFFETTVGAGLPFIYTLKSLLVSGDEILEIRGNFSGTLGFILSHLEEGYSFSSAVKKAKKLGFTETDPRDDLRGTDMARKILILARTMGRNINFDDIKVQSLFPKDMGKYTILQFLKKAELLNSYYKNLFKKAAQKSKTIRYVGIIKGSSVSAKLMEVDKSSDLGNLKGPDNLIVFKTSRYLDRPLVIKGPGAGIEVTAAGVINDILHAMKIL